MIVVGLLCLAVSYTTLILTRNTHGIAVLWVGNAILQAAVLARPAATVRLLLAGSMAVVLANLLAGTSLANALAFQVANLADVMISVGLMRRFGVGGGAFFSMAATRRFLAASGVAGPAISATIGAAIAGSAAGGPYLSLWFSWFTACSLGSLVVIPVLVGYWCDDTGPPASTTMIDRSSGAQLLVMQAVISICVFGALQLPALFAPFAATVIAMVMQGQRQAMGGIAIAACAGLISLLLGTGPLMLFDTMELRILMLQAFLAVLAITCLPVAAVLRERQLLSERLAFAEARHRLLSEEAGDALLHVAPDGVILHASRAVTDLTGLMPDELIGRLGIDFVDPDDKLAVAAMHHAVIKSGDVGDVRYRFTHQREGDQRWLEARTRAVWRDDMVAGVVTTVRDVTALVAQEAALTLAAATDSLTGLTNRRSFMAQLEQAVAARGHATLAVAMLDIDHFKRFNDVYGHVAGDTVLRSVGTTARSALRADDVLARLGGEEFAILLSGADFETALAVAERVRGAIEAETTMFEGSHLKVTVSIGAAVVAPGIDDGVGLLAAADRQLYAAKAAGRNRICIAA